MKQDLSVQGTSRRAVIVPTDDESIFEQVICIVREDAPLITAEAILREAQEALHMNPEKGSDRPPSLARMLLPVLILCAILLFAFLAWCYFFGA